MVIMRILNTEDNDIPENISSDYIITGNKIKLCEIKKIDFSTNRIPIEEDIEYTNKEKHPHVKRRIQSRSRNIVPSTNFKKSKFSEFNGEPIYESDYKYTGQNQNKRRKDRGNVS